MRVKVLRNTTNVASIRVKCSAISILKTRTRSSNGNSTNSSIKVGDTVRFTGTLCHAQSGNTITSQDLAGGTPTNTISLILDLFLKLMDKASQLQTST